eukprot:SAG31_NODE_2140_length_6350_cov_2.239962_4_plen_107_part_00
MVTVEQFDFGVDQHSKRAVHLFQFTNRTRPDGLQVSISTWGAAVVSVLAPDRHGTVAEVTLNYRDLPSLQKQTAYYGATIGRVVSHPGLSMLLLANGAACAVVPKM